MNSTSLLPTPLAEQHSGLDGESTVSAPLGAVIFTLLLSATAVGLRVFTRRFLGKRRLWVDDYFAVFSYLTILGTGVAICFMAQFGLGTHVWTLSEEERRLYLRAYFVSLVLYALGLFAVKVTIILQHLRMLGKGWTQHRRFLAVSLVVALWSLSEFWISLFVCSPIDGFWEQSRPSACIPDSPFRYIYIAGDILTASVVFFMPALFMRDFVLGRPEAVVLALVYTLGLFVVVLQFVRIRFVDLGPDFTWENADRAALMMAELSVALFCSCVPLLHPLAERVLPRWFCTLSYEKQVDGSSGPPSSAAPSSRAPSSRVDAEQRQQQQVQQFYRSPAFTNTRHPFRRDTLRGFGRHRSSTKERNQSQNQNQNQREQQPPPPPPKDDVSPASPDRGRGWPLFGGWGADQGVRVLQAQVVDDSGDQSEEILGLDSTRKAMNRASYMRGSHSDNGVAAAATVAAAGAVAAERRSLSRSRAASVVTPGGSINTSLHPPPASHHHAAAAAFQGGGGGSGGGGVGLAIQLAPPPRGRRSPVTRTMMAYHNYDEEGDVYNIDAERSPVVVQPPPGIAVMMTSASASASLASGRLGGHGQMQLHKSSSFGDRPFVLQPPPPPPPPPQVHVTRGFAFYAEEYIPGTGVRPELGGRFATTS